uniref:BURP domain-containing protein n=1 Tax=Nymphaea colorata TaxID=210225 RepID=A0A5K1BZF2_9MAGN
MFRKGQARWDRQIENEDQNGERKSSNGETFCSKATPYVSSLVSGGLETFQGYSEKSNVVGADFKSYGSAANGFLSQYTSYSAGSNVITNSFTSYNKEGNDLLDQFTSYSHSGNVVLNEFQQYADRAKKPDNVFWSYRLSGNGAGFIFGSYGNSSNPLAEFTDDGKDGNRATASFSSYVTEYTTFKEYHEMTTTFGSYINASSRATSTLVEPGKFFREADLLSGNQIPMPDIHDKMPPRSFLMKREEESRMKDSK